MGGGRATNDGGTNPMVPTNVDDLHCRFFSPSGLRTSCSCSSLSLSFNPSVLSAWMAGGWMAGDVLAKGWTMAGEAWRGWMVGGWLDGRRLAGGRLDGERLA